MDRRHQIAVRYLVSDDRIQFDTDVMINRIGLGLSARAQPDRRNTD